MNHLWLWRRYSPPNSSTTTNESFVVVEEFGGEYLLVPNATKKGYAEAFEGDSVDLAYPQSKLRRGRVGNQVSQALLTSPQMGVVVRDNEGIKVVGNYMPSCHNASKIVAVDGVAPAVMENHGTITAVAIPNEKPRLRIRKLTERECGRLQAWDDEKITYIEEVIPSTWQYHVYGDGITISVVRAILKRML